MRRSAPSTSWKRNTKSVAAIVVCGGFLAVSLWLGDELWSLSPYWPGSGIGFGATVGVLLPISFTAAKRSFRRISSDEGGLAARWVVAGTVYAAVALVCALAASRAVPGKGSSGSCRSEWQPCWVNHLYPGAFLVTLGSFVATVVIMHWLPSWRARLRVLSRR
ncbi:hypothetical protein ACFV16_04100 [Streptomyces massasporeus]|uniref:hypothetical protein n=1 Tax=Streptomyces massasporeus TaxID=67324 RepID=UPI0036CAD878